MTTQEILTKLAKAEITAETAQKLIAANTEAEVKAAKAENGAAQALTMKANPDKRTMSLYGLGRNPVSLYRSQWVRMFAEGKAVVDEFIAAHGEYLPINKSEAAKTVPASLIGDGKPFRVPKAR